MKINTYEVAVTGYRCNIFNVTGSTVREAKEKAEKQFVSEYGDYWDNLESTAIKIRRGKNE